MGATRSMCALPRKVHDSAVRRCEYLGLALHENNRRTRDIWGVLKRVVERPFTSHHTNPRK